MKIFIDAGHGGKDPGAVYGKLIEKNINIKVAKYLEKYLIAKGHKVILSRATDIYIGLDKRASFANANKVDVVVSIHANAGKGDGAEIIYQNQSSKSKSLATIIESEFKAIGQNSRGLKTKTLDGSKLDYFGMLRNCKAVAVITEFAFVDNEKDNDLLDSDAELKMQAEAIGKAIIKFLK